MSGPRSRPTGERPAGPEGHPERERGPASAPRVALAVAPRPSTGAESILVLDGGDQAYPRMLRAIEEARSRVHLEVYAFAPSRVGALFIEALAGASSRGVKVLVKIDGWGSARGSRAVAAELRDAGCELRVHNPLSSLLLGRFGRNHRKILLVDDEIAFLGGINIGDENIDSAAHVGWADLALEIRGPQCARLGREIRGEPLGPSESALHIHLCGLGGGWRLRRRYLAAFAGAQRRIHLAHGYFLPDMGIVRAIAAAARRGVEVHLLFAGLSDVPFGRTVTRSLHARLLAAGVHIREWEGSVLHAKVATVDGNRLLLGSFNLDPFSLANLETLVEVVDPDSVEQVEAWIQDHFARSSKITSVQAGSWPRRWALDPLGRVFARLAEMVGRLLARRRHRRATEGAPSTVSPPSPTMSQGSRDRESHHPADTRVRPGGLRATRNAGAAMGDKSPRSKDKKKKQKTDKKQAKAREVGEKQARAQSPVSLGSKKS